MIMKTLYCQKISKSGKTSFKTSGTHPSILMTRR